MTDVYFEGYGVWLVCEDEEASYPISERYPASGVFSLTKRYETKYQHTGSLEGIDALCPSDHPDSEFSKMVRFGKFDHELAKDSDYLFSWKQLLPKRQSDGTSEDDIKNALQLEEDAEAKKKALHDLAKKAVFDYLKLNALFVIDTKKKYILEPVETCEPDNIEHPFSENERNKMLTLIIGMAIDAYGYDPTKTRNEASGGSRNSISERLKGNEIYDISISNDTIHKYFTAAKELLKRKNE